jgi:hypothetical protein
MLARRRQNGSEWAGASCIDLWRIEWKSVETV